MAIVIRYLPYILPALIGVCGVLWGIYQQGVADRRGEMLAQKQATIDTMTASLAEQADALARQVRADRAYTEIIDLLRAERLARQGELNEILNRVEAGNDQFAECLGLPVPDDLAGRLFDTP